MCGERTSAWRQPRSLGGAVVGPLVSRGVGRDSTSTNCPYGCARAACRADELEWLDKQLNRREFITGPRYRIAGVTTQAGVGCGTRAAGLKLDLALANVFAMVQLKCRAARARRRDLSLPPDEQAGLAEVYFILRFDRLTPGHGFRSRIVRPRRYPRPFWNPPGILGRRRNTRSAHQKTCTSR